MLEGFIKRQKMSNQGIFPKHLITETELLQSFHFVLVNVVKSSELSR